MCPQLCKNWWNKEKYPTQEELLDKCLSCNIKNKKSQTEVLALDLGKIMIIEVRILKETISVNKIIVI